MRNVLFIILVVVGVAMGVTCLGCATNNTSRREFHKNEMVKKRDKVSTQGIKISFAGKKKAEEMWIPSEVCQLIYAFSVSHFAEEYGDHVYARHMYIKGGKKGLILTRLGDKKIGTSFLKYKTFNGLKKFYVGRLDYLRRIQSSEEKLSSLAYQGIHSSRKWGIDDITRNYKNRVAMNYFYRGIFGSHIGYNEEKMLEKKFCKQEIAEIESDLKMIDTLEKRLDEWFSNFQKRINNIVSLKKTIPNL